MGRGLFALTLGLISASAFAGSRRLQESTQGKCVSAKMVSGRSFERRQNVASLQFKEESPISRSTKANYVRIQPRNGKGEYEFDFSAPLLAGENPITTSITVEFLALVARGSGSRWSVDILNSGNGKWESIGDLSQAQVGFGWTAVPLKITGSDLANYLNPGSNNQIAIRVRTETGSQRAYVDFAQVTVSADGSPTPAPTPPPTPSSTPSPTESLTPAPTLARTPQPTAESTAESNVVWVEKESGEQLGPDQDQDSLKTKQGSAIRYENRADYVRIDNGDGAYNIFFSPPPLLADDPITATSIAVEFSALVELGNGREWSVEIMNFGQDSRWDLIGDLSPASPTSGWTTKEVTITTGNLAQYLDSSDGKQILVRVRSESQHQQVAYMDFVEVTASAGGPPTPTATAEPSDEPNDESNVVWVEYKYGQQLGDGQNQESLKQKEGSAISDSTAADYVRIQTNGTGFGAYEFYFSTPSFLVGDTSAPSVGDAPTVFEVEFFVFVDDGSGSRWSVEIFNRGQDAFGWEAIGDLSAADSGSDSGWTTVAVSTTTETPTEYLDAGYQNQVLVRVHAESPREEPQVAYIDFMQVTAFKGELPTPAPTAPVNPVVEPSPTLAPTLAPMDPPPVGSQQRWAAFEQFVPNWVAFNSTRYNGKCDRMEECRTDPACCGSSTAVCGNGVCEEGETREGCNKDCTHYNSVCGNGICEQSWNMNLGYYHINMYENEFNCPVDCTPNSPNLDVYSDVTGSCFMRDMSCEDVCGDGICGGDDTCVNCPRDCGECIPKSGDGICSYPFEAARVGDCNGSKITNFITYNGEDYATIDNADPKDGIFEDASCTSSPLPVPPGWRLADWDAEIAQDLVLTLGAKFDTGCLVFDEGNAASTTDGLQGDAETSCGIIPIVRYNGNRFAIDMKNCASRLMIQRIKSSGSKTCPSCGNGGSCNTLTGKCACLGLWTGPTCNRAIGDFSVPDEFSIPPAATDWYKPPLGVTWEWQIDGVPIPGGNGEGSLHDVELYDIDYTYSSAVIADLQSKGRKVMCYISAGTSEDFRDDINLFPEEVKGSIVSFGPGDEFPDEKWLDLRRLDLVAPIMLERLDIMQAKGCDAVEWDNADLPVHTLGLDGDGQVSVSVQIAYNAWIAAQTHARGMGVAMKNNNEAAAFHVDDYDMVVNEECWINGNCNNYWPWINAGKPILNTEYFTARCMYCFQAEAMNMSTIKKVPDLTSCRMDCKSTFDSTQCDKVSVDGIVSYPIDWTVGTGAVMKKDWCPMTLNTDPDECPSNRFRDCDSNVGY